jgi:uncharacterized membrane protein YecN with MAPEG domain
MNVAIICTALLGLLLFVLGLMVSVTRGKTNTSIGYKQDPADPLYKLVRAHGNTAEYAPMLAVLFLFLAAHDPAGWVRNTIWATTACRFIYVIGMIGFPTLAKPNPMRFVGALGTYVGGIALCMAAFLAA